MAYTYKNGQKMESANIDCFEFNITASDPAAAGQKYTWKCVGENLALTSETDVALLVQPNGSILVEQPTAIGSLNKLEVLTPSNADGFEVTPELLVKGFVVIGQPNAEKSYTIPTAADLVSYLEDNDLTDINTFQFKVVNEASNAGHKYACEGGVAGTTKVHADINHETNNIITVVVTNFETGSEAYTIFGLPL